MVIYRVLKVNGWVLHMKQKRLVYWGNQYLGWYWDHYLEHNWRKHRENKEEPEGVVIGKLRDLVFWILCE